MSAIRLAIVCFGIWAWLMSSIALCVCVGIDAAHGHAGNIIGLSILGFVVTAANAIFEAVRQPRAA